MKIVLCSSYLCHHELYLALSMIEKGIDFHYIANKEISKERIDGGWEDLNSKYEWVVRVYESKKSKKEAQRIINEADLMIVGMGSFPWDMVLKRAIRKKPVFFYSERFYRANNGDLTHVKNIKNYLRHLIHRNIFNYLPVYMLCSSAYTSYDCSIYKDFLNKCYKWGYFTYVENKQISNIMQIKQNNKKIVLLWVARFLKLKHPEDVITIAKRLKDDGYDFEIRMIGIGPEQEKIKDSVKDYQLENYVYFLGSMSTEKVREEMDKANIFLFTSDFYEGWGAVLNEAMSSGCAVVCSHSVGAAPFLIDDKLNGLMYNYGDNEEFYKDVKFLIDNKTKREEISVTAYNTIKNEWNPQNAVEKVLLLYEKLINNKDIDIPYGVCSKAEILDNNWRHDNVL